MLRFSWCDGALSYEVAAVAVSYEVTSCQRWIPKLPGLIDQVKVLFGLVKIFAANFVHASDSTQEAEYRFSSMTTIAHFHTCVVLKIRLAGEQAGEQDDTNRLFPHAYSTWPFWLNEVMNVSWRPSQERTGKARICTVCPLPFAFSRMDTQNSSLSLLEAHLSLELLLMPWQHQERLCASFKLKSIDCVFLEEDQSFFEADLSTQNAHVASALGLVPHCIPHQNLVHVQTRKIIDTR